MGFIIGLLTFVMVLDCLALILLVLIQLPKIEAGAGLACGGAATVALFGAGSGTVLTKVTKYAAGIFFALAILLAILQSHYHNRGSSNFLNQLNQPNRPAAGSVAPGPGPAAPSTPPAAANTNLLLSTPAEVTNQPPQAPAGAGAPAPAPTNAPAPK